jgi:molybdopterin synthase catalytic subunit
MRARVLFFGVLKELVGRPSEEAELPAGTTLGAVLEDYARRFPRLREMTGSIAAARNQQLEDLAAEVRDGDELAFLPPVSGGTDAAPQLLRADPSPDRPPHPYRAPGRRPGGRGRNV